MEILFQQMETLLSLTSDNIVRADIDRVPWSKRLVAIRGARGVGKTTLMLQYVKRTYGAGTRKALYCSLDWIYFSTNTIVDLARTFRMAGGEVLLLDEVHKYGNWSREIKEIYDTMPDLRVIVSGSSLLNIINSDADLSRRCRPYEMHGLSFREFARFYHGIELPLCTLDDLLSRHAEICKQVNEACHPVALFKEYLSVGYYPFFDGDIEDYHMRIGNVANYIIEQEMPLLCGIDPAYARKLKALLVILATTVPFEVDISKLASTLGLARTSVLNYLQQLQKAALLTLLYSDNISVKKMQKPDKIYLQNPNLMSAFAMRNANIGAMRESFVVSQLSVAHTVEYGKANGDFKVDGVYTFEVGGSGKTFSQISGVSHSYLLVDDTEKSSGRRLPIWLVGLLY